LKKKLHDGDESSSRWVYGAGTCVERKLMFCCVAVVCMCLCVFVDGFGRKRLRDDLVNGHLGKDIAVVVAAGLVRQQMRH